MQSYDEERMQRQIAFCEEIDKEKFIKRQTYCTDGQKKENDAEHAWHMAVMAMFLSEYSNEDIDLLRTIEMLLIHDLVEIDAGDTYAYDDEGKKTQADREEKAASRLFHLLPRDQAQKLYELWREFEEGETAEAKFARTMDNFQPLMLNGATGGKSWEERKIHRNQVLKRNENTAKGSRALWEYADRKIIEPNVRDGKLIQDEIREERKAEKDVYI